MGIQRRSRDALRRVIAGAFGAVALAGMALSPDIGQAAEPSAGARAFTVVVTIKPVHALAAAVLGTVSTPELLIEGAGSPHTYALKPSQVRGLHQARAVLMVSDDLETFMGKVATTLPRAVKLVKLDQAPGLARLPVREGGLFEKDEDHGHGHGHKHGQATARGKAPMDAHFWLDPENGKAESPADQWRDGT